MMTRWCLILLMVFFSAMSPVPSTGEELSTFVKKVASSIIAVLTYNQKGRLLDDGKGCFISREVDVITNRHQLEGASRMKGQVTGVIISRIIEGHAFRFILPSERTARLTPAKRKTLIDWEGKREDVAEMVHPKGPPFIWKKEYKNALSYFKEAIKENPRYGEA
jgi:hypothetical protein